MPLHNEASLPLINEIRNIKLLRLQYLRKSCKDKTHSSRPHLFVKERADASLIADRPHNHRLACRVSGLVTGGDASIAGAVPYARLSVSSTHRPNASAESAAWTFPIQGFSAAIIDIHDSRNSPPHFPKKRLARFHVRGFVYGSASTLAKNATAA